MDDDQKSSIEDTMKAGNGNGKAGAKKLANATKKGWKKIKSIKQLAPLVSIISTAAIVLLIIFLVIGFVGFFITLPGLGMEKVLDVCKNFWNWFTGAEKIEIDKTQIIDLGEYIENLGYDLVGNGFVTEDNLVKDSDTGEILDIKNDGDGRNYLYAYILQNERTYTARQANVTGATKLLRWVPVLGDQIVGFEKLLRDSRLDSIGAENYGMLVFDNAEFDDGSAMKGDFKVEIDREKMVMRVKTNSLLSTSQFEWNLDGWTGRYGKPIELSLALHLSTMAPDFAYNFCQDSELQTQVYLNTHEIKYNASYKYDKKMSDGTVKEIERDEVIKKYESAIETSTIASYVYGLQSEDAIVPEDAGDTDAKRQLPIGVLDNVNIAEYNGKCYRVIDKDGNPLRVIDTKGEGIIYKATIQSDRIVFEKVDKNYWEQAPDGEFVGSLVYNSEIDSEVISGSASEDDESAIIRLGSICLNEGIELLNVKNDKEYFYHLCEGSGEFKYMKSDLFDAVDRAINQFKAIQESEANKNLPESMQLNVTFVRGDVSYADQLYSLYDANKMDNQFESAKQDVFNGVKNLRTSIKKDYNTLIENIDKAAAIDLEFIDDWEMDGRTLVALYKVMKSQQSTIKTYQPYIKYVNHHWYKDVYFDSTGLDDYNGEQVNVYDLPELMSDKDYEVYNPDGLASSDEVELLQQQGELYVKLETTDGTTEIVQNEDEAVAIIKTEPWHYKVKNWLTSGYFFIYDGTVETAEKIEEARKILRENTDYDPADPLLGVDGTNGLLTEDEELKNKFSTNEKGEITIDVNAQSKIESIDAKAEEYNNCLKECGSSIRLQKINFAKKSSLEAFSILEGVHTNDAEYVYRDLKEFLIELGYFSRGDFDAIESGILDWMIPGFTPDNWPMPKYGDELYEYGNVIRYGVNKTSSNSSDFIAIADKIYRNIIDHNLIYDDSGGKDSASYTTDNPGLGTGVDCSAYVSAVVYALDPEKYSQFAIQQWTGAWSENIDKWSKEYGWTYMKQDGSITVDQLQPGDIVIEHTGKRHHIEIFMEAVDPSNPKSAGYMYNCGWAWWNDIGVKDNENLYKNQTSDMWTDVGAYIIRINDGGGNIGTVSGETNSTLGGQYNTWMDAAGAVKNYVAENNYIYNDGSDPRNSTGVCCASYVAWALNEYGYDCTSNGELIRSTYYLSKWCEDNGFQKVFDGYTLNTNDIDLQPGDIVVMGSENKLVYGPLNHVQIYAGKDSSGNNIWYNCGSDGGGVPGGSIGKKVGEDKSSDPYTGSSADTDHHIVFVYRLPGDGANSSGITSLDDFLFIGDSRTNQIESKLQGLGNNITAIGVGYATPENWIDVTKNKTGIVYNEQVTLPDNPKGIVIQGLGVNGAASEGQLDRMKTIIDNLSDNYSNVPIFVASVYKVSNKYGGSEDSAKRMNEAINNLNSGLSEYCKSKSNLYYIDVQSGLDDSNGFAKVELCDDGGLHLLSEGQEILITNLKNAIFSAAKRFNQKEKPNGFEENMNVVCPGECTVLSVSDQTIKLKFGIQDTEYNKNLINGYTLYVEGFQVDTVNITEGISLKRGDVMGITLKQDIKLILMDDKKAILNNIEDYMKPDGKGSTSGINNVYGGDISATENGIRTEDDILYAIDKAGWPENRKKNVEAMMDGLLRLQSDFDIDPLVAIALFCGESGVGTAYEDRGEYRLDNHMHWTGCKCSYHQSQGFACYDNYSDNAYDWGNYIRNRFDPPITTWDEMANYDGMTIYENCNVDDGGHAISIYKKLIEALETK